MRRALVAGMVLVVAVAAGWWFSASERRPALAAAIDALPADTVSVGFTDWASLRARYGHGADLESGARAAGLLTRSAIAHDLDAMASRLGWSGDDLRWEVFGQTLAGTASVLALDDVDPDEVEDTLAELGWERDGDRWSAPQDALGASGLSGVFTFVAVLDRQGLVVLGDTSEPVDAVVDVVQDRSESLAGVRRAADTAEALADADSVLLHAGEAGCAAVEVPPDAADALQVAQDRTGDLVAHTFSGRGLRQRDGTGFGAQELTFAMTFDSPDVAQEQLRIRSDLATGTFIGAPAGTVEDTLRLDRDRSSADGSTLTLRFDHDPDTGVFMVGSEAIFFAGC